MEEQKIDNKTDGMCKFKIYSSDEIVEMLKKLDLKLNKESIEKPDVDLLLTIYESIVGHILEYPVQKRIDERIDEMDNCKDFQGHISFSRILIQFKVFSYILKACKMTDFDIRDLTHPTTERVRLVMSAFLNFAIYQETAMSTFLEIKSDVMFQIREEKINENEMEKKLVALKELEQLSLNENINYDNLRDTFHEKTKILSDKQVVLDKIRNEFSENRILLNTKLAEHDNIAKEHTTASLEFEANLKFNEFSTKLQSSRDLMVEEKSINDDLKESLSNLEALEENQKEHLDIIEHRIEQLMQLNKSMEVKGTLTKSLNSKKMKHSTSTHDLYAVGEEINEINDKNDGISSRLRDSKHICLQSHVDDRKKLDFLLNEEAELISSLDSLNCIERDEKRKHSKRTGQLHSQLEDFSIKMQQFNRNISMKHSCILDCSEEFNENKNQSILCIMKK